MSDRQQRIKALFDSVVELESPQAQQEYLTHNCPEDPDLRAKVLALVNNDRLMGQFMEHGTDQAVATMAMPGSEEIDSQQIGHYKLREQLGEGGMGIVYVAEQTEPVRRKVALKIIKPGMDSKEVIARFEAERQALAMMSHPNIAKVLDGGTTEQGRPYFVMELVKGIPITKFCDERKLSLRERLELFVTVCEAVQHAHLKGVIHRDLKPSNVLVELHDVKGVPKVIDFGIAKAINQQLTQQTIYTQFSQLVGTPLYMSPEQAELSGLDVDTRSDVYSLGVMLYELLTGVTPFDESTLSSVGLDEMRRIIREDEPPRPSYKVSTLDQDAVSTISVKRQIDSRQLSLTMQRELDWIVMQALEKDRTRRYESASDLAQDIQRYLDDEPVQACPPSVSYRLRKFARRHTAVLATITLIVATLLIATVVSVSYAVQADSARQDANLERDNANDAFTAERLARQDADNHRRVAEQNFERAEDERIQAERNLQFAIETVDEMYNRLGREWIADDVAATQVQTEFLNRALLFYRRLVENSAEFRLPISRIADLFGRIADIERELHHTTYSLEAREQAVAQRRKLCQTEPQEIDNQMSLVSDLLQLGAEYALQKQHVEALKCYDESYQLASALQLPEESLQQILRYWRALIKQNRAALLLDLNRELDLVEELASQAQSEYEVLDEEIGNFLLRSGNYSNYARTFVVLSEVERRRRNFTEAERIAADALRKCEFALGNYSDSRDCRDAEEILNSQLAVIALAINDYSEAARRLRRQLEILSLRFAAKRDPYTFLSDMLFARDPELNEKEQPELWHTWASINMRLGQVLRKQGEYRGAEILLGKTQSITGYLGTRFPQELKFRVTAANSQAEVALLLKDRWPQEAHYHLLEAAKTWHETLQAFPEAIEHRSGFHDERSDFNWFQTTFPEYDLTDPNLTDQILNPQDRGRSSVNDRVLGMAAYRHEEYKTVATRFQRVIDLRDGSDAYDQLYLSIGLAMTGEVTSAREYFASALKWIEQNNAHNDEELQQLRAEAEELLASIQNRRTDMADYPPPPPLPAAL